MEHLVEWFYKKWWFQRGKSTLRLDNLRNQLCMQPFINIAPIVLSLCHPLMAIISLISSAKHVARHYIEIRL